MWKDNIIENHPNLSDDEKKIWYKSFANFCISIDEKYTKEKEGKNV